MNEPKLELLFKNNLNILIERKQCTQADLARYLGVTRANVNNWCKGITCPKFSLVDKICLFFGITRNELLVLDLSETSEHTPSAVSKRIEALSENNQKLLLKIIESMEGLEDEG